MYGNRAEMDRARDRIEMNRIMAHIDWFLENTPDRLCTSPGCWEAMRYISETMRSYGLRTEVQEFFGYNSTPLRSRLTVLQPEVSEVPSVVVGYAATTPPEGVRGALIDVGGGGAGEYVGDVAGAIVMARLSYAPPAPEKARIAASRGAKGVVLVSWGRPGDRAISRRAIKGVWGNPTDEDMGKIPDLPVVAVSRSDGEVLEQLLRKGPVEVELYSEATREWMDLWQPLGYMDGRGGSEDFVILSGHLDSWVPGATDNIDGNAVMLELARVLRESELRRSVAVAFWTGHEVMEATGSTWYVDSRWDAIRDHAAAYLNVDSPGLVGADHLWCLGSREFFQFMDEVAGDILPGVPRKVEDVGRYADQSFRGVGVPAILVWSGFNEKVVRDTGGAILGWWNHTEFDTRDKIDVSWMRRLTDLYLGYVMSLAVRPLLPLDYRPVVQKLVSGLVQLRGSHLGSLLNLDPLALSAGECLREVTRLHEARCRAEERLDARGGIPVDEPLPDEAEGINVALMRLGRILSPVAYTVGGKYAQDPYGLSSLDSDIPCLDAATQLLRTDHRSPAGRMLMTRALRQRNMLSDALRAATEAAAAAGGAAR